MRAMDGEDAYRLARRCWDGVDHDASARRAWARLSRRGRRGDQVAIDEAWRLWLRRPIDKVWEALSRWQRPVVAGPHVCPSLVALGRGDVSAPNMQAALIDTAARTDHPIGDIARNRILAEPDLQVIDEICDIAARNPDGLLASWCREHRLAPADPVQRAVFFVLTGQAEQHRAADPDGALLALGYRAATRHRRDQLRAAMVAGGALDLVRVVIGADRRSLPTTDEITYLSGALAARRDWAGLWRLVGNLRLVDAVRVVRQFDPAWRPRDDEQRRLFERLAAADPDAIALGRDHLFNAGPAVPHVTDLPGEIVSVSFSPDGRRLVVASTTSPSSGMVSVFELPTLTPIENYPLSSLTPRCILTVDDGVLVGGDRLIRLRDGIVETVDGVSGPVHMLSPHNQGFVALEQNSLLVGGRDGELACRVSLTSGFDVRKIAVEPGTARVATAHQGGGMSIIDPLAGAVLADLPAPDVTGMCFLGPDQIVGGSRLLYLWRLDADRLTQLTHARVPRGEIRDVVAVPQRGEVAILTGGAGDGTGSVHHYDAGTLAPVHEQRDLGSWAGTGLWSSPGGEYRALTGPHEIRVFVTAHPAARWLDRPLSEATPADLAAVIDAERESPAGGQPFLRLLVDILRDRFTTDISLGSRQPVGDEHDIGLAGG